MAMSGCFTRFCANCLRLQQVRGRVGWGYVVSNSKRDAPHLIRMNPSACKRKLLHLSFAALTSPGVCR